MGLMTFDGVGISGLSAVVPRTVAKNADYSGPISAEEVQKAMDFTGIRERRIVDNGVCTSDLMHAAGDALLKDMAVDKASIDLLICVTQTPDYRQPPNASLLQTRLDLPRDIGAWDVNLACAGYVYGLSSAYAYASNPTINRVLLLVGETSSRMVSHEDPATALLFGDAATATLIEKVPGAGQSWFSLNTDGSGADVLCIPGGGYRNPSSSETLAMKELEDGGRRSDEQLFMNGLEVFKFTMAAVGKDLKKLVEYSGRPIEDVDLLVYHQSNRFMTDHFTKKLQFPPERVPYTLDRFGNTSAASIPLTLVSDCREALEAGPKQVVMCGYGGGLSWGTALVTIDGARVVPLIET